MYENINEAGMKKVLINNQDFLKSGY